MIDLSKIKSNNKKEIIDPVKIFASLPNKDAKYNGYLRNVQSEVLNKWFELRDNRENIIKMNTGSGKTTVSLLILQSCINEKKGNAIYVVPDNYLIEQVLDEAKSLGLRATNNMDDIDYIRNRAILVISIQKLINGKSKFIRKNIDNILIDDVHACLEIVVHQFKISVEREVFPKLYEQIISLFERDLKEQNYNNTLNIIEGVPTSNPMLVPFWAVQSKYKELIQIINMYKNEDNFTNIEFAMSLIGDIIELCNIVISYNQIEITPDCIPIQKISGFDNASRRIYVSATLKDDGVLLANFNINPNDVKEIITPNDALDIGNRIILYPQINNPTISEEEIKQYLKIKSYNMRVVVLVPSKKRAEFWSDVCDRVFDKANIDTIKDYTTGLDIVINRYNGIDLKDELCRILVIDGLPDVKTMYGKIKEIMLFNTNESIKEQMQKIEQGMGRGIRSNQDYCGIVLMGKSLSNIIYEGGAKNNFGISTLKQFELSESLYDDLNEKSLPEILENLDLCIERDKDWIACMNEVLTDIKYDNSVTYDEKDLIQHQAYQYALKKNFSGCIEEIQKNVNTEKNLKLRGYYKMMLAKYMNLQNQSMAQNILLSAKEDNGNVLVPLNGYTYKRTEKTIESQTRRLLKYIRENYNTEKEYFFKLNSISGNLVFAPQTFRKFEEAIYELGNNLGYSSSMPEREIGKGPDVFWSMGNRLYLVIECKNEAITETISKSDSAQLLDSCNWAASECDEEDRIIGVIIHKGLRFDEHANPDKEFLLMSQHQVEVLSENIKKFAASIMEIPLKDLTESKLKELLISFKFSNDKFLSEYLYKPKLNK